MRCPNCGYISLDYLDRCTQCRTDLTAERRLLNLLEGRPNPVSLSAIMARVHPGAPEKDRPTEMKEAGLSQGLASSARQGVNLENPVDPDPDLTSQSSKESKQMKGLLELTLEGLDFGPSSKEK